MPKPTTYEILRTDLSDHPAVRAWRGLHPDHTMPAAVEILQQKARSVFRLRGVGRAGSDVIAKSCPRLTGLTERTIYKYVLLHLPLPAPLYYGYLDDAENDFCWLFLGDVGGEEYSPLDTEHRLLAARWLGALHTATARFGPRIDLPDCGPARYREHLRAARGRLLELRANPRLGTEDRGMLEAIAAQCDRIESSWNRAERACESMPRCLVHGDFAGKTGKNMRVRSGREGRVLMVFDWEVAGWGAPAVDLAECPDLLAYWSAVRSSWPRLDFADIQRLARVGKLFRCLASIDWRSLSLAYEWVERPMRKLRYHHADLHELIHTTAGDD